MSDNYMSLEGNARQQIDKNLIQVGWIIQNKNQINLSAGLGIAVREYPTDSISPALQKPEDKIINIYSASQDELPIILQISEPLAQKIITLRDKLGGFKEPRGLLQLPELTNLEWEEWEEQGITITI